MAQACVGASSVLTVNGGGPDKTTARAATTYLGFASASRPVCGSHGAPSTNRLCTKVPSPGAPVSFSRVLPVTFTFSATGCSYHSFYLHICCIIAVRKDCEIGSLPTKSHSVGMGNQLPKSPNPSL
ncbi:hypothetical protein EGR_02809 [Echinococcus granulosus]|uniref:Uncharacterized protein n=1 Tax=Echinococcus granulosus TaxID=6210 RepID=W6UMK3_ECHGR|nr:hypothetical protein EGR_02809 [Echinococcus granulosus]EUB62356.1 hypothetical protein EGR_02809 [Echinococcus granulosus]